MENILKLEGETYEESDLMLTAREKNQVRDLTLVFLLTEIVAEVTAELLVWSIWRREPFKPVKMGLLSAMTALSQQLLQESYDAVTTVSIL